MALIAWLIAAACLIVGGTLFVKKKWWKPIFSNGATTEDHVAYMRAKGVHQTGDEQTVDFSDDEGPAEPQDVRRERRTLVRLARATAQHIESRARDTDASVRQSETVGTPEITADGNWLTRLFGIPNASESTFRSVRAVDPDLHTELKTARFSHRRSAWSAPAEAQGHVITFNLPSLIKQFTDAKKWKTDICMALLLTVVGAGLLWYVISKIGAYF